MGVAHHIVAADGSVVGTEKNELANSAVEKVAEIMVDFEGVVAKNLVAKFL